MELQPCEIIAQPDQSFPNIEDTWRERLRNVIRKSDSKGLSLGRVLVTVERLKRHTFMKLLYKVHSNFSQSTMF